MFKVSTMHIHKQVYMYTQVFLSSSLLSVLIFLALCSLLMMNRYFLHETVTIQGIVQPLCEYARQTKHEEFLSKALQFWIIKVIVEKSGVCSKHKIKKLCVSKMEKKSDTHQGNHAFNCSDYRRRL